MADAVKFPGNESVKVLVNCAGGTVQVFGCLTRAKLDPAVSRKGWVAVESWFEREAALENFEVDVRQNGIDFVSMRIVKDDDIPRDRSFRGAWGHNFVVDMPKAREIHRGRLRRLRKPLLEGLDTEFMRAVESGDTAKQADIARQKQDLRDLPARPEIEAARTPAELKAVAPDSGKVL
jgi:hypothetical protein